MTDKQTKTHWFNANQPITTLQTLPERDFKVIKTTVTDETAVQDWVNVLITTNKGE